MMSQEEIGAAFVAITHGDTSLVGDIIEGLQRGDIVVTVGPTGLVVRARPPAAAIADKLSILRQAAGDPSLTEIATQVEVSVSVVSRVFAGQRAGSWPLIYRIVEILGGDPKDFKALWHSSRTPPWAVGPVTPPAEQ